ncbi:MAG: UDP-N-acetylmuramoyl-L-alanine--D-glutamate ligase [Solirubrobacteraceae bacterium]
MKFSELDGARVVLWGLGRETAAFTAQLERRLPSARITAVIDDSTPPAQVRADLQAAEVLVRSPGVSIYKPLIQEALADHKTVTTATGLWLAERQGRHVIGVTGTKGKSTTATVIAHLISPLVRTELAGNIGRPVIDLLDFDPAGWVVLELSSYQIADLPVGPEVAVLTNLSREHTDWHRSEQRYRADKLRIFDLPGVRVGVRPPDGSDSWYVDGAGAVCHAQERVLAAGQIPLRGRHNAQNVATALAAIEAAGLARPHLPEGLAGLQPLPHRLQTVHIEVDGLEWVDDSISTTPESTIAAIEAFPGRSLVLIAGGQDRRQDHSRLAAVLAARVEPTRLVSLPDTGARIVAAAGARGFAQDRMLAAGGLREAVELARRVADPGAVVLLSPAAPSFNAYRDFEQRGEHFASLARGVALPE